VACLLLDGINLIVSKRIPWAAASGHGVYHFSERCIRFAPGKIFACQAPGKRKICCQTPRSWLHCKLCHAVLRLHAGNRRHGIDACTKLHLVKLMSVYLCQVNTDWIVYADSGHSVDLWQRCAV